MAHREKRAKLITQVFDCLAEQVIIEERPLIKQFTEQFFMLLSYDDLRPTGCE